MAFKTHLTLTITGVFFKDFEDGKNIIMRVPLTWRLEENDVVSWVYGNRKGRAIVISPVGVVGNQLSCTFRITR